jgi:hypothetical protein
VQVQQQQQQQQHKACIALAGLAAPGPPAGGAIALPSATLFWDAVSLRLCLTLLLLLQVLL